MHRAGRSVLLGVSRRPDPRPVRRPIPGDPLRYRLDRRQHEFRSFNPLDDDTLQVILAVGTTAADSRIRDTDYALESAVLARNQIIQEAAVAVIGQANANMSFVLRLLE
ncbi:MAG: hypothetical protein GY910_22285 [bacterium]|nr:hypothetical protein [Deltaproteobacteria bacterium]MCP4907710.1 hypothetical protein [bacterium]